MGPRKHVLDGVSGSPVGRSTFEGTCRPTVLYLPPANVPAQRTWRTNAFAAVRGDKTAMRPLATLLWTLVILTCVNVQL